MNLSFLKSFIIPQSEFAKTADQLFQNIQTDIKKIRDEHQQITYRRRKKRVLLSQLMQDIVYLPVYKPLFTNLIFFELLAGKLLKTRA